MYHDRSVVPDFLVISYERSWTTSLRQTIYYKFQPKFYPERSPRITSYSPAASSVLNIWILELLVLDEFMIDWNAFCYNYNSYSKYQKPSSDSLLDSAQVLEIGVLPY